MIGETVATPDRETDPITAPDQRSEQDRDAEPSMPKEIGGRIGPDPTRYGDWEKNGRCIDF